MIGVCVCIQNSYGSLSVRVSCILLTVDIISCYEVWGGGGGCNFMEETESADVCLKSSASLSPSVSEQARNENERKQQCAAKSSRATPSP